VEAIVGGGAKESK